MREAPDPRSAEARGLISGRPKHLIMITGTGTELGKTWVAVELSGLLAERGHRVGARKPAQSFDRGDTDPTDADRLAVATGEHADLICPPHRWYPMAMAPPMAAEALLMPPFTVGDLAAEVQGSWPSPPPQFGLVEAAGGVASPQADDGDTVALIDALAPDLVVVVAVAALGSINLIRLSLAALGSKPVIVHLNRWDGEDQLQVRNRQWLTERDGVSVTTTIPALADRLELALAT